MSVNCDIVLQWKATPVQLTALGAALWRWCNRAAGGGGVYQQLDNQALADLIAGKLPQSSQAQWPADRQGVHFWVRGQALQNRQAIIGSLRHSIPAEGIEDIVIDGKSWNLID
jgi:hypothetical protein